jgi:amidase
MIFRLFVSMKASPPRVERAALTGMARAVQLPAMSSHSASDLYTLPAHRLVAMMASGETAAREVVSAFLDRIDALNGRHNAIVSLRPRDEILAEADAADRAGHRGALSGLPIAVKDVALTRGLRTTFGSRIFADHVPEADEFFVQRLRAAGAIIIGKTNVPEFGLGSHTYNEVFGTTLNALDPALSAGGSSGGAAVALALDMVPLADGSDMCGSLRNPAGWNGIYGMRPSQGRVPGGPADELFQAQMGVEGPMARNVRDLALLLDVMAGHDDRAPLSLDDAPGSFLAGLKPADGGKVAWLGDLGGHLATEPGVLDVCEGALDRMGAAGFGVEQTLPAIDFEACWQAFLTLRHATSGVALRAHYDDPDRRPLMKPEAVFEVEGSLSLKAVDIHRASVMRSSLYAAMLELFRQYDFVALPSAQIFAFPAGIDWPAEVAGRSMDSYHRWMEVSALATMCGLPVVSVPAGRDGQGRAMGLQLIGRPRDDAGVLAAALAFEKVGPR